MRANATKRLFTLKYWMIIEDQQSLFKRQGISSFITSRVQLSYVWELIENPE